MIIGEHFPSTPFYPTHKPRWQPSRGRGGSACHQATDLQQSRQHHASSLFPQLTESTPPCCARSGFETVLNLERRCRANVHSRNGI